MQRNVFAVGYPGVSRLPAGSRSASRIHLGAGGGKWAGAVASTTALIEKERESCRLSDHRGKLYDTSFSFSLSLTKTTMSPSAIARSYCFFKEICDRLLRVARYSRYGTA